MRLFGRVELTTVELPNALEFSISRESGLVEWAGGMVIGLLGLWMFWKVNTPFSRLIVVVVCVAAAASAIASWVQGGSTKLRVTADELFAEGNLNKLFSTEVRIPASEIASLGHNVGNDGEPSVLYVKHGWSRTCVLSGLDADQGSSVTSAIFDKFPEIAPEDTSPGSPLYGTQSELTTLGLSDSQSERPKTK